MICEDDLLTASAMMSTDFQVQTFSSADATICRLCACKSQQTIHVFDKEFEPLDLLNTIQQCLQIKIYVDDLLPKDVCLPCCEKLRDCHEFYLLCSHTQIALEALYDDPDKSKNDREDSTTTMVDSNVWKEGEEFSSSDLLPSGEKRKLRKKPKKSPKLSSTDETPPQTEESPINVPENHANPSPPGNRTSEIRLKDDVDGCNENKGKPPSQKLFENYIWECTACKDVFNNLPSLKGHYSEVHKREADFKCMKCTKVYPRYRSFVRHAKLHENPGRFECERCGKKFAQKTVLQSHMTVHTEERPHVCPQCGKAFKQFSSLYLHGRSHLPEQAKPKFFCPVCRKKFSSKLSMENHLKLHTGEKNFSCEVCGKGFIAKSSLKYHILSHSEGNHHSCATCNKTFKTARLLAKHASLHSGNKPHQCDVCGKQFREQSSLKEHSRIHTGEMPYACQYCGKTFRFKGNLTIHVRQHTGERPYSCSKCSRTFTNWANFNKHQKRQHSQLDDFSPPASVSLPSLDFDDPLTSDALEIHDLVFDSDIDRQPFVSTITIL